MDTDVAALLRLAKALTEAGLVQTLKGDGPFTVFAPTDEAFARLPPGTLDALLKDKAKLQAVLTYHGGGRQGDGVGRQQISTKDGVKVNQAKVVKTDIMASNGIIHVIDAVVLPN